MMDVLLAFGLAKIGVSLVCLIYACFHDFRCRVVPNRVWVLFGPSVMVLSLVEYMFFAPSMLAVYGVVFAVIALVSFACYFFNVFGGADVKCLLCLAAAFPVGVVFAVNFAFSFLSAFMLFLFLRNMLGLRKPLFFGGLERESTWRKLAVLFIGKRVDASVLEGKWWIVPLQSDGHFLFKLKEKDREKTVAKLSGKVWVSEGVPMIVFLTLGLAVTFLVAPFAGI